MSLYFLESRIWMLFFHSSTEHLKLEGRPPSFCPSGRPSAPSSKSGQWTPPSKFNSFLSESHLINQADIRDGKNEQDDADKEKPESVSADGISIHPKTLISTGGSVPPKNVILTALLNCITTLIRVPSPFLIGRQRRSPLKGWYRNHQVIVKTQKLHCDVGHIIGLKGAGDYDLYFFYQHLF